MSYNFTMEQCPIAKKLAELFHASVGEITTDDWARELKTSPAINEAYQQCSQIINMLGLVACTTKATKNHCCQGAPNDILDDEKNLNGAMKAAEQFIKKTAIE